MAHKAPVSERKVEVEACPLGERSGLAVAAHSAVDEFGIAGQALVGSDAKAFGDAGAKPLDQPIGLLDEIEHRRDATWGAKIHLHRPPISVEESVLVFWVPPIRFGRAIDEDDVSPHVGQQHAGERSRAYAEQFDDLQPRQWSHGRKISRPTSPPPQPKSARDRDHRLLVERSP